MRIPRIYFALTLEPNAHVLLQKDLSHYLHTVLRLKVGNQFIIFNGEGGEYLAEITNAHAKKTEVRICRFVDVNRESPLRIHLGQGISRGERMDFAIQKAVELGVYEITPLITDFVTVKYTPIQIEKKMQHWRKVIISACEQSERTSLPILNTPQALRTWCQGRTEHYKVVCHLSETSSALAVKSNDLAVLIGPEGGLSTKEFQMTVDIGFVAHQFGPRILRTETATAAVLSILQSKFGDMA